MADQLTITVSIDADDYQALRQLVGVDTFGAFDSVELVVEYLAICAATGVRRRGSWERGWLLQATGAYYLP